MKMICNHAGGAMNEQKIEANFPKDVAAHTMTVLLDQGLYRHLRFANGDSSTMAFDLLTYPGGLMIRGDMGCFVFERNGSIDMFGFFRDDGGGRRCNEEYWETKVKAQSIWGDGIRRYDEDEARADIEVDLSNIDGLSQEGYECIMEHLGSAFESEEELRNAMVSWDATGDYTEEFQFDTDAGRELRYYTTNYLWCIHAIVWGIEQYDLATEV